MTNLTNLMNVNPIMPHRIYKSISNLACRNQVLLLTYLVCRANALLLFLGWMDAASINLETNARTHTEISPILLSRLDLQVAWRKFFTFT